MGRSGENDIFALGAQGPHAAITTIRAFRVRNQCGCFCLIGLLISLAFASSARASGNHDCPREEGSRVVKNVQGAQVEFAAARNDDFPSGHACEAVVRDSAQNIVFSEEAFDFSLVLADVDVNGDRVSDLVLESYSGGAHCCWSYYIISLGENPVLLKQFDNERAAAFVRNEKSGRIELVTQDGAFDYFDNLCHACTVFPEVYLRLDGDRLVDAGAEHVQDYDEIIANSQQTLSAEERQTFRSAKDSPYRGGDATSTTAQKILSIVFAYLYSGREAQAHQAIQELWPPYDEERVWKLILETRQKGVLSQTHDTNRAAGTNPKEHPE